MNMQFVKATKEQANLRLAIFGPSGSGKTFTSLRLAAGLGGTIAVIDTERGSASKYSDRFDFDVLDLPKFDIDTYITAIVAAGKAGYKVLIIDSLSHGWFELIDEVDRLARAKYRGNTWSAWSEGTPKQRRFVDAMLNFDGHMIATMRTKTEWVTEKDSRGKTKPVRIGLAPQQGKGIEYEFDLLMEMTLEHIVTISKDRTGKFQDRIIDKPGEELGAELAAWLQDGAIPAQKPAPKSKLTPELPANGDRNDGYILPEKWAHLAELEDDADLDALTWQDLAAAAVSDLGYNHNKHVSHAMMGEIGAGWGDKISRTQAWAILKERKESKD